MWLGGGLCGLLLLGIGWWRRRPRDPQPAPPVEQAQPAAAEQPVWLRAAPQQAAPEDDGSLPDRLGPYQIQSTLGRGGMATVYKALDTRVGRVVALKVVSKEFQQDEEFMRRFEREIEITGELKHANLIELYEAATYEGRVCMALELAEGLSLHDILQSGPLPLEDFPLIACQIAAGLHYAHRHQLLHRDIKADNIFVGRDALVKVLDFGLAIADGQSRFTSVGFSMGTPSHMAPEGFRSGECTALTDQYALGVVFYQMLTGRLPFWSDNPMELARLQIKEAPPVPSRLRAEIPAGYEKIVLRMLSKDPEERYSNLSEVRSLLNAALLEN